MNDLLNLNMNEALYLLDKKKISALELTKAYIDNCEKHKNLNAYITTTYDIALQQAQESDDRRASNTKDIGLMDGVPIAIKDLFCTKGVKTTASSKMLENFVPEYESTITQKLFSNGSIMLGKVSCDEFAMGSSNTTSYFGSVKSPWLDKNGEHCVPGGSSGGSATAVSARMALAATGTDTGGSIRQPASFCGIVGLKPTYGTCSRWGVIAFASSLDQAGPMTRTVEDAALMLNVMGGNDPKDSTTVKRKLPNFKEISKQTIKGMKIGIPKEYRLESLNEEVLKLWQMTADILKQEGAEIIDINLPHTSYALPCYYIIAPAEASSNLARYDGVKYGFRTAENFSSLDEMYKKTRSQGFGKEVKRRILIGTYTLSAGYYDAYFVKAQKVRRLILNDFKESFSKVDVILTPSSIGAGFTENNMPSSPLDLYMQDIFSVPASLAGLPALSLPAGCLDGNLPIGMQLIGNHFDESSILKTADKIEQAVNFDSIPPILRGL